MNICILNGSPKGQFSVTYQTVLFLEKKFPQDCFETLHVGKQIKAFEKDFQAARASLEKADLILFCYPVYTFLVPSQLHRFIELMIESGMDFTGKKAAQLSTSKHFFDTTAHAFISDNCVDLGLDYLGGLSADMEDLTHEKGQKEAVDFWNLIHFRAENNLVEDLPGIATKKTLNNPAKSESTDDATPEIIESKILANSKYTACVVTDLRPGDNELASLIKNFRDTFLGSVKIVNLRTIRMDGGCLGCLNCAITGKCVYKDGFDDFLRQEIQSCNAIVYAFTIKNHSMGALMKKYDDRQFCNGHRTVTMGMPYAYLVNGDLSAESNLREVMDARAQVAENFLAGVALNQEQVPALCKNLTYALDNKLTLPSKFYGVGGMKIFRDLIWVMGGLMKADYKFYKKHGFFDFPQKKRGTKIAMIFLGAIVNNKKIKAKMGNAMTEGMLMPYKKVLKNL